MTQEDADLAPPAFYEELAHLLERTLIP
jgi:hypothetical protein